MKKALALLLATLMLLSIVPAMAETTRPVMTIDLISYAENDPTDDTFEAALEELTGYEIKINWIPTIGYADKINTLIASDSMSRITVVTQNRGSAFVNAARTGMFWQIDDYMADYQNLAKLPAQVYDNVRIDGGLYGIPRERALVRQGLVYRKDWAEEAGLGQPKSIDDIKKMVETFAAREGVKYGVTTGYQASDYLPEGLLYTAIMYGAPNGYGFNTEGEFTHYFTTPEYFNAVKLWREWYEKGLMNKNYLEINQDDGKTVSIVNQEAGLAFHYADGIGTAYPELYVNNPDAQMWFAYGFTNEATGEDVAIATSGFNGLVAFSKTANPTEEDLKQCLDFCDKITSDAAAEIFSWGVEGYTYSIDENGYGVRSQEQYDQFYSTCNYYGQFNLFSISNTSELVEEGLTDLFIAARDEKFLWYDVALADKSTGLESKTWLEIGSTDLTPILSDTVNMYITGQIDDDGYWAGVQEWLEAGGQDVIDEYKAAYEAAHQ